MELTRALSDHVDGKTAHIEKFLDPNDGSVFCDVEIGVSTKHHQSGDIFKAEFNLHTAGKDFRAEAEKEDLYVAINDAKDQIVQMIKSEKTKERTMFRKGAKAVKDILKGFGK